jgi:AmmeMemoRadiSam system protein B
MHAHHEAACMTDLRPSPIAGTWYPGNPDILTQSVDSQLEASIVTLPPGEVIAVVAPHAGHRYSGLVAAHAFRCLAGKHPEVVAIVSPLHQPYPGQILTSSHEAYATPLGPIPVDREMLERLGSELAQRGGYRLQAVAYDQEHSLEIELPFLQRAIGSDFRLLPIMLRDQSEPAARAVGQSLAAVLRDSSAVLVASSDLSHFYPDPIARRLDTELLARIEALSPERVLEAEEEGVGFACGRGAIASVMWAAQELGADRAQVLAYANSGDVTGDTDSVVGYGAVAIYRSTGDDEPSHA